MRFIIDIDVEQMEELSGKTFTPETVEDIIKDSLDNAGLETCYAVKLDDQVPDFPKRFLQ